MTEMLPILRHSTGRQTEEIMVIIVSQSWKWFWFYQQNDSLSAMGQQRQETSDAGDGKSSGLQVESCVWF